MVYIYTSCWYWYVFLRSFTQNLVSVSKFHRLYSAKSQPLQKQLHRSTTHEMAWLAGSVSVPCFNKNDIMNRIIFFWVRTSLIWIWTIQSVLWLRCFWLQVDELQQGCQCFSGCFWYGMRGDRHWNDFAKLEWMQFIQFSPSMLIMAHIPIGVGIDRCY